MLIFLGLNVANVNPYASPPPPPFFPGALCISGWYPCYTNAIDANAASSSGNDHGVYLSGACYFPLYTPNTFQGNAVCPTPFPPPSPPAPPPSSPPPPLSPPLSPLHMNNVLLHIPFR